MNRISSPSTLLVNRVQLLEFFDEAPRTSQYHATAVVAVAGEELGTGLLVHYFNAFGLSAKVVDDRCTPGAKSGPRLDAWAMAGGTLYQVEVKNWSAHAIGGVSLSRNASPEEIAVYRRRFWKSVWPENGFRDASMGKVLRPMKRKPTIPQEVIEPLICFWTAMHPDGGDESLFTIPVDAPPFSRVHVFSMSNYLRSCSTDTLKLEMPKTRQRLEWLSRLVTVPEPSVGAVPPN